jgi:asparagine synthase (glutamine-hydrolysing)
MCGIIGGYGGMDPETASRMLERVVHRGPDDEGRIEVAGNVLGHRRLSIVDVDGGKQPLVTPDGARFWSPMRPARLSRPGIPSA